MKAIMVSMMLLVSFSAFSQATPGWELPKVLSDKDAQMVVRGYRMGFESCLMLLQVASASDPFDPADKKEKARQYKMSFTMLYNAFKNIFGVSLLPLMMQIQNYAFEESEESFSEWNLGILTDHAGL